jgi:hypothetical protein
VTLTEVRARLAGMGVTVIRREGYIVARHPTTARHGPWQAKSLALAVGRMTGARAKAHLYRGRRGLHAAYWAEAIIREDRS